MTGQTERYWQQYLRSLPNTSPPAAGPYDTFSFGTTKESARQLAELVLAGVKTATESLVWMYEAEGRRPPRPGDYSIVTDGQGGPVCVIQTTEVGVLPYDEVDQEFAFAGGEEDRTLSSWRRIYWEYIVSECARIGREPHPKTPLVCERFRVRYKEPLAAE